MWLICEINTPQYWKNDFGQANNDLESMSDCNQWCVLYYMNVSVSHIDLWYSPRHSIKLDSFECIQQLCYEIYLRKMKQSTYSLVWCRGSEFYKTSKIGVFASILDILYLSVLQELKNTLNSLNESLYNRCWSFFLAVPFLFIWVSLFGGAGAAGMSSALLQLYSYSVYYLGST